MTPRLAFAIETARAAGWGTIALFQRGASYELKDDLTPITQADIDAEALIRAEIAKQFPGEEIIGEEQGGSNAPERWVIDPIDGTKSFVAGIPTYATLISYEQVGEPVLGVCYFPALDEIVYAERGNGCFWNGRPCNISGKVHIENAILCCGSHHTMVEAGRMDGFLSLADKAFATRGMTDAYGHALVATGRTDAMIDPVVLPWDVSAMSVIVREAGGSFVDFKGNDKLSSEAISCTPGIQQTILEAYEA